jgi:hypothetical protein
LYVHKTQLLLTAIRYNICLPSVYMVPLCTLVIDASGPYPRPPSLPSAK